MHHFVLKIVAFGSLLVACSSACYATPSPCVWVNVTPLGLNARDFFFLKRETRYPGSHYNYSETRYSLTVSLIGTFWEAAFLTTIAKFG